MSCSTHRSLPRETHMAHIYGAIAGITCKNYNDDCDFTAQIKYVQFAFGIYLQQVHAYVPVVPHSFSLSRSQVQQLSIIRVECRV